MVSTFCWTSASTSSATRGRWREDVCAAVAGAAARPPSRAAHAGSSVPDSSAAAHSAPILRARAVLLRNALPALSLSHTCQAKEKKVHCGRLPLAAACRAARTEKVCNGAAEPRSVCRLMKVKVPEQSEGACISPARQAARTAASVCTRWHRGSAQLAAPKSTCAGIPAKMMAEPCAKKVR